MRTSLVLGAALAAGILIASPASAQTFERGVRAGRVYKLYRPAGAGRRASVQGRRPASVRPARP